jgi:hypothetical protein
MMVNGSRTEDPAVIQDHIVNFYKTLYSEQYQGRPTRLLDPLFDNQAFSSIDEGERLLMKWEFEEDEVWEVVKKLKGAKAPSPDEFTMAFFQKC